MGYGGRNREKGDDSEDVDGRNGVRIGINVGREFSGGGDGGEANQEKTQVV